MATSKLTALVPTSSHFVHFQAAYTDWMSLEFQDELSALRRELNNQITTQKPSAAKIDELLRQVQQQLIEQFQLEEQAMAATSYPYLLLHRHQHQRASENLARHLELWKKQRNVWALRDFVDKTLTQWLDSHRRTDLVAALFVAYVQETKA